MRVSSSILRQTILTIKTATKRLVPSRKETSRNINDPSLPPSIVSNFSSPVRLLRGL